MHFKQISTTKRIVKGYYSSNQGNMKDQWYVSDDCAEGQIRVSHCPF